MSIIRMAFGFAITLAAATIFLPRTASADDIRSPVNVARAADLMDLQNAVVVRRGPYGGRAVVRRGPLGRSAVRYRGPYGRAVVRRGPLGRTVVRGRGPYGRAVIRRGPFGRTVVRRRAW